MRAEDLFEAMDGLDEKLIARSDVKRKRSQKVSEQKARKGGKNSRKKKKAADIYRYTVIALASAAAVFLFLMARDFLGPRPYGKANQSMAGSADSAYEAEGAAEASPEDAMAQSDADVPAEGSASSNAEVRSQAGGAADASSRTPENAKTAVDLLGDLKGDYVRLEYISAADESAGAQRKVPSYTKEGEDALSHAFEKGKKVPAIMADKGAPVYYVYLTDSKGKEEKVTFYENGYISMASIPGVVLKEEKEEYDRVLALFE
jgi:hypothetical protein